MRKSLPFLVLVSSLSVLHLAHADTFTLSSPAGGALPASVSPVGGIVTDLIGTNGTRVVAQVAASTEYIGMEPVSRTPALPQILVIGAQGGITPDVVAALGGGLSAAAFRVTLYDGDNQLGNFDYNQNFFYVGATDAGPVNSISSTSNGVDLGNFSAVSTERTDGLGKRIGNGAPTSGFGDNLLDTGFFSSTDASTLADLFAALTQVSTGEQRLVFQLRDNTPGNNTYDQYYDFTQGIDASLVDVGSGPVVNPTAVTPEPSSLALLGTGLLASLTGLRRRMTC